MNPNQVLPVSINFAPFATGNHDITATVGDPADNVNNNDVKSIIVNVAAQGTVQIKNYFVTPTLLVDTNGCASISPLEVSGFVDEDNVGTSDRVLIYVDNRITETVNANAAQGGLFEVSISDICFSNAGNHTIRADVDRGAGVLDTKSRDVNVLFSALGGNGTVGGSFPHLVDVEASPRILRLGAGEFSEYLLSIENLGTTQDTYDIKVSAPSAVDSWLDLETNILTVDPGQTKFVSLFIDLPDDAAEGSYPINVIVQGRSTDIDRLYLDVQNAVPGLFGGAAVPLDHAVDIELSPQKLDIESGEADQFIATVRNFGSKTDTYKLNVLASSKIRSWFRFERSSIVLAPGEEQQLKVFVDVPVEAQSQSYPVSVEADGVAIDIDRGSLSVIRSPSSFDVEVGKATVSPNQFPAGTAMSVAVKASVSFADLKGESSGENVLTRLYVNGQSIGTQNVFVPSGETKQVTFNIDTGADPINTEAGVYNIYIVASAGDDVDRGEQGVLTLVEPGAATITYISTKEFNTTANSEVALSFTIKNEDLKDNTYALSAEGSGALSGKVTITPESAAVPKGEARSQDVKLKIANAQNGSYTVTLKATAEGYSAEKGIIVNINGGQVPEVQLSTNVSTSEVKDEGGPTGNILIGTGGVLAALIGALLLAFLYLQYYRQGKPFPFFGKNPTLSEGGEAAVAEAVKKEEAPKVPSGKEKPLIWTGAEPQSTMAKQEKAKGQWSAEEAEKTLLNLESIRDSFKKTAEEAGKVKDRLSTIASQSAESLQKSNVTGSTDIKTE